MKSISQKLQDDIRAIMEAGLHPNQQKIDVHEPEKDKITAHDFKKLRSMKKTPDGKVHDCATHVEHAELGRGVTISEQHAEPDENGDIEWYAVQFDSGVYKVYTEDMDIIVSEAHHHGGMMKKEDTDNQIQELAGKAAQQAAIAISLIKAGKKDGKMPKPMKEDSEQVEEEEKKKVVSPFDYKNYQSQIPKKPGETAGFDSKKISTGTVYTKKPVKEDADLDEAKSESKKDMMARQQRLAAAGAETAKNPARMKKMSSIPGYSAAMDLAKKSVKEESHQSKTTMKHIPNASPALKKAAKDIKPGVAGYKDRVDMLKAGGVKEEVEQEEYTFADYLEAARAKYVDEDAVLVANEAFKNKDITLFSDQSQSPEA